MDVDAFINDTGEYYKRVISTLDHDTSHTMIEGLSLPLDKYELCKEYMKSLMKGQSHTFVNDLNFSFTEYSNV
mgnify:CR=1 FL=1